MIIKAVIFDLVGTLINSPTKKEYSEYIMAISELLNVSAERLRATWSEDQERRFKGIDINFTKYIHHVCERIGITYPRNAAFEKFYQQASILFRWMKPRADASATLKQIKKSGLMLGLISDAAYEVPRLWEKHSLSRFFDVTIFSNKVHLKNQIQKYIFSPVKGLTLNQQSACMSEMVEVGSLLVLKRLA